ncbi:MAG TPA: cell division protein FtsZ [Candidatus Paceibacterota bacterium]|jgi:cell division protein FtsZ|nr:cell division protein FtsZ [Candidatus Paceibacterota bacterium]HRS48077.1 cell division protein FtsZ [Candidatus Paceibacterota bacterium]
MAKAKKIKVKVKRNLPIKKSVVKEKSKSEISANLVIPKIKIIGIGGAGGNALNRLDGAVKNAETIAINTDAQDLKSTKAHKKIQIGKELTLGRGAGMDPQLGENSALLSKDEILKALEGAELIFITCGLGGGTGSGAAPVVAQLARSLNILTIAIVTLPFSFEGEERKNIAQNAWDKLNQSCDSLITISNDRIFNLISRDTSLKKAFWQIDEVLREGVKAIIDLIIKPGLINVDFADLKTIIQNSGPSLIGIGTSAGKERAIKAANLAISSPLLNLTIENARKLLFNISSRGDLTMFEIQQAAKAITSAVSPNAKIIFGTSLDYSLTKNKLKIVVIAGDFEGRNASTENLNAKLEIKFEEQKKEPTLAKDLLEERIKPFEEFEEPTFLRKKKKLA